MMERLRALGKLEPAMRKKTDAPQADVNDDADRKDDGDGDGDRYESERDRKEQYLFNHVLKKKTN